MDRTAAEQNLSLRDPPQAENPAPQDSIFIYDNRMFAKCAFYCFVENIKLPFLHKPRHKNLYRGFLYRLFDYFNVPFFFAIPSQLCQ